MKWPLSMSFAKLTSRTADAGEARYTLAGPGLLNPDCRYFWRVRAQDKQGRVGSLERHLDLCSARTGAANRGRPSIRSRPHSRRPPLVTEPEGSQAHCVPDLCQRRKGLLDQRPALRGHHRNIPDGARRVSGELCRGPRHSSKRWWVRIYNSRARTKHIIAWSQWMPRARGVVHLTLLLRSGPSSSASPSPVRPKEWNIDTRSPPSVPWVI